MNNNKCCGTCEHCDIIISSGFNEGICKEYETHVTYNQNPCGFYCRKREGLSL